jgi:hypothetical protein
MRLRRILEILGSPAPAPRLQPHRLFAVYSGALSPAAAARLGLGASVQSAQESRRT